eukprot:CAMPEP_0117548416 /NCGR_PEP_ID=MMETSP0784-20121206/47638_1 /TAXON_ID=39447 /ORGANISM="" /LENGTH=718 /DNA_ID=CAMNT_0005345371 /DNA_START=1 /DNA_END=2157 /DNA_ORIENTATION=-
MLGPLSIVLSVVAFGPNAADSECVDTIADTESPIKDCSAVLPTAPCGTMMFGINISQVCKKTCGLCAGAQPPLAVVGTCPRFMPPDDYSVAAIEGTWYEIGKIQTEAGALIEGQCVCTTATYRDQGFENATVAVQYGCRAGSPVSPELSARALLQPLVGENAGMYRQILASTDVNYFIALVDDAFLATYDCVERDGGTRVEYCFHIMSRDPNVELATTAPLVDRMLQFVDTHALNPADLSLKETAHSGCWNADGSPTSATVPGDGGEDAGDPNCVDTIADTPSPVKDCRAVITMAPCGTVMYGLDISDVCKKTCGVCVGTGDGEEDVTTTAPRGEGWHYDAFQMSDGSSTSFRTSASTVEVTSSVPVDTDWFGYHMYTFGSLPGDTNASFMYVFKVRDGPAVEVRSWWLSFFGSAESLEGIANNDPVWECPARVERVSDGKICLSSMSSPIGEGDFMVGDAGVALGMRAHSEGLRAAVRDFELHSVAVENGFLVVRWSRSRDVPLDTDEVKVRFAVTPKGISTALPPVLGYMYHGASRLTSAARLEAASGTSNAVVRDGALQHNVTGGLIHIGGLYGWSIPPANTTYADVTASVGDTLRFVYLGFHNVARFPSAVALDACDISNVEVLGGNWDSPFDLVIQSDQRELYLGVSSTINNGVAEEPVVCQDGMRLKVFVNDAGADEAGEREAASSGFRHGARSAISAAIGVSSMYMYKVVA